MQPVCPSCGAETAPGRRYCHHCGVLLQATGETHVQPASGAPETEDSPPVEKPKRKRRWLLLVGALVALCLVGAIVVVLAGLGAGATPTPPAVAEATPPVEGTEAEQPDDFFAAFNLRFPDFAAYLDNVSTDVSTELDGIMDGLGRVATAIVDSLTSRFQGPTR